MYLVNQKNITLSQYNNHWPLWFENESKYLKTYLGDNLILIEHIGSTAIPGMIAKPKIDIIASVKNGSVAISALGTSGYKYKGEWNIPFKFGFTRRGDVDVNLHVFEGDNPEIEANILFRDYLRNSSIAKAEYANLKKQILLADSAKELNSRGMVNYTLQKGNFIREILRLANFRTPRILKVNDDYEQQYARRYNDLYTEHSFMDGYEHLALYHGADIVGYAEIYNNNLSFIKIESESDKEFFINLIQKWLSCI